MLWEALDKTKKGLVTVVFDTTDRIQHMFFRYLDPKHPANRGKDTEIYKDTVEEMYLKMDDLVGRVRQRLKKDEVLIVMSDHGFKQFQRGVNLNAWLRDEGYLVMKDPDRSTGGDWFENIDWSKTKAFTMGLTGVFLNRKGRETGGIVGEGAELEELKAEMIRKLTELRDPERPDEIPIRDVFDASKHVPGPYVSEAPDLLIGYGAGYRHSWDAAVGCTSEHTFSDNTKSWSGDHCMDPRIVPGVLFSNRKVVAENPNILDLAPTVLDLFGIVPPKYMQGTSLYEARPAQAPVRQPVEAAS